MWLEKQFAHQTIFFKTGFYVIEFHIHQHIRWKHINWRHKLNAHVNQVFKTSKIEQEKFPVKTLFICYLHHFAIKNPYTGP